MTLSPRADLLLAVAAAEAGDMPLASALARQLGSALAPTGTDPASCENFAVLLVVSDGELALRQTPALTIGCPPPGKQKKIGQARRGPGSSRSRDGRIRQRRHAPPAALRAQRAARQGGGYSRRAAPAAYWMPPPVSAGTALCWRIWAVQLPCVNANR